MKNLLMFVMMCFMITFANAQSGQAIGIRGIYDVGGSVTYKINVHNQSAFEVIGTFYKYRDFDITALYEIHRNIGDRGKFSYYYGIGGHTNLRVSNLAAVGVLGLDYRFSKIPLNLSLDWIPTILTLKRDDYRFNGGGLAIRYMF